MRWFLFRGKRVIDGKWAESCCPLGEMHSGTVTYDFDQKTVCQYIGLTDKNGKKIFEGDIVTCTEYECYGYISWNESEAGFYFCILLEDGGFENEQLYDYSDELEVIGNIFDNPELLEVEE